MAGLVQAWAAVGADPELGDLGPLKALAVVVRERIDQVRANTPTSDSIFALSRVLKELEAALIEAREQTAWVSVSAAARWSGLTEQAITHRCRQGHYAGARKDGGVWRIPRACLNLTRTTEISS